MFETLGVCGGKERGRIDMLPDHNEGQAAIEYALITIIVAIVTIVILLQVGAAIGNIFSNIIANL